MYTLPNQNMTTLVKQSNLTLIPGHIINRNTIENVDTRSNNSTELILNDINHRQWKETLKKL